MNYPVWDVPVIGSGWVIGGIAIFHVLISHFAIGGGFYLPMAERKALREGRDDWMEAIHRHAKFFLVLTAVFGAVSGVGIWFAIGLANPEGTSTLIHNFVFGWAIEWTFFIVEITAAMVYYYTWGRVSDKIHLRVGWVYAGTAWMSLFVINGILTFMLTPGNAWLGVAGTGAESSVFWQAFFNPTYWPSLALRTLICISLAGVWALVTASRIDAETQPALKEEIIRWSVKWLLPSFLLLPVCFAWLLFTLPDGRMELLRIGINTIGSGAFTQVTRAALVTVMTSATIAVVVYFLAWRNPKDFTFGHAIAVLLLALAATASTEQAREMIRKPYVVVDHMYSNGIRRSEVEGFNQNGYLAKSIWITPEERARWSSDPAVRPAADTAPAGDVLERGKLMFQGQCLACHTATGYRSMAKFLEIRDRAAIENILEMLHRSEEDSPYRAYMPPLVGTDEEIAALAEYLTVLAHGQKEEEATKVAAQE
ncbi:MAG: cytochrome ubiquinol oxidase subunit I [Candidatus Hydrogenedentes bacterium]|nr:cytochrome ubiquinol oxidase subunit I [Candidatus Hydrogenedentota bacterium]